MKMAFLISFILAVFTSCASYSPPIDPHETENALLTHKPQFRACGKGMNGYIRAAFAVEKDGRVRTASIQKTTFQDPQVANCLIGVIKTIQFPIPNDGKPVQIVYPFRFHSK
jgi:hypothetical protein